MLRPGGDVDCWCGTCKMILAHTIEAMAGAKPARVHCNTCNSQHAYKATKPAEPRKRAAGVGTGRRRANSYQVLLEGKDMAHAKRYSPQTDYALGDVVEHPNFGVGVATALKEGSKIEVLFEAGTKLLVHRR